MNGPIDSQGRTRTPFVLLLAPELWDGILARLDPPDIISLGKTCKQLDGLCTRRSLWVQALRTMCLEQHLFSPSYPVDEMDLDTLKCAAMGPYLFNNLVHAHSGPQEVPDLVKPPSEVEVDLEMRNGMDCEHYLIPGGRFLVTVGQCIMVWDLGVPGRPALACPVLISKLVLREYNASGPKSTCLGAIGDRFLRIAVVMRDQKAVVFEIRMDEEKPALRPLPGPIYPGLPTGYIDTLMHGDRVSLFNSNGPVPTLVVWDYIAKRYVVWELDCSNEEWFSCELMFYGDLLLTLWRGSLKVWVVPTLEKTCNDSTTHTALDLRGHSPIPYPPDATFTLKPDYEAMILCPSEWYPKQSEEPLIFDACFVESEVVTGPWARYQLSVTFHDDDSASRDVLGISCDLKLIQTFDFPVEYYPPEYLSTFPRYTLGSSASITIRASGPRRSGRRHPETSPPEELRICGVYTVPPAAPILGDGGRDHPRGTMAKFTALSSPVKLSSGESENWSLCAASGRLVLRDFTQEREKYWAASLLIRSYLV